MHVCVDKNMQARKLCFKQHRPGKRQRCCHISDPLLKWVGQVELFGDFRIEVAEARKEFKRRLRRWTRELGEIRATPCAPAFRQYLEAMLEKHLTLKPVFCFPLENIDGNPLYRAEALSHEGAGLPTVGP